MNKTIIKIIGYLILVGWTLIVALISYSALLLTFSTFNPIVLVPFEDNDFTFNFAYNI